MATERFQIIVDEKGSRTVRKNFDSMGAAASRTTSLVKRMSLVLAALGVGSVIKGVISAEKGLFEIAKTTGLAGDALKGLGDDLGNLSKQMPQSIDELQGIAATAGQLGIQGRADIAAFTETVAKMATTTDLTADAAASSLAELTNIFKLPVSGAERLGSAMNEISNTTNATAGVIANFSQRLGPVAKAFNITAAQVIGISGTLKDLGFEAEIASTAMNKIFAEMATNAETFASQMGVSVGEFQALFRDDAVGALQAWGAELAKVDPILLPKMLEDVGVSAGRGLPVLLALIGGLDKLDTNLKTSTKAFEENISLQNEFDIFMEAVGNQLSVLGNIFRVTATEILSGILPALKSFVEVLREGSESQEFQQFVARAKEGVKDFADASVTAIPQILDLASAVGDILGKAWDLAVDAVQAGLKIFDALATALSPLGELIMAVAEGLGLTATEFGVASESAASFNSEMKDSDGSVSRVANLLGKVLSPIIFFVGKGLEAIVLVTQAAGAGFLRLASEVIKFIKPLAFMADKIGLTEGALDALTIKSQQYRGESEKLVSQALAGLIPAQEGVAKALQNIGQKAAPEASKGIAEVTEKAVELKKEIDQLAGVNISDFADAINQISFDTLQAGELDEVQSRINDVINSLAGANLNEASVGLIESLVAVQVQTEKNAEVAELYKEALRGIEFDIKGMEALDEVDAGMNAFIRTLPQGTALTAEQTDRLRELLEQKRALRLENEAIAANEARLSEVFLEANKIAQEQAFTLEGLTVQEAQLGMELERLAEIAELTGGKFFDLGKAQEEAVKKFADQQAKNTDKTANSIQTIAKSVAQGTEDLLVDMITNGEISLESFSKLVDQIISDIIRAFIRTQIINAALGSSGLGLPGFKHGTEFKVGGTGGPDSQLVAFWASPDETVSVKTPAQQSGSDSRDGGNISTSSTVVNVNVEAKSPDDFVRSRNRMASFVARDLERSSRRTR